MPALSAMRYNPAIVALVVRLKNAGRLRAQANRRGGDAQATGDLLRGVLKTGKPFDAATAMPA